MPKSAFAFRTIGEVADELGLSVHVLRSWESKFPQLKPLKRSGGRRYYRPEDVALLRRIRQCLHQEGYTIRGVQQLLEGGSGAPALRVEHAAMLPGLLLPETVFRMAAEEPAQPETARRRNAPRPRRLPPELREALEEIRSELLAIRQMLDTLRRPDKT